MADVFDPDGNALGDVALSDKLADLIERGERAVMIYHTPQLLRYVLGERKGTFTLRKAAGHIMSDEPDAVKDYIALQRAIQAARD
jgi:hypothetical protein